MKNLEKIKHSLNNNGYNTYIYLDGNEKYLKGGFLGDDTIKNISVEIWVRIEDDKYVFLDIIGQTAEEKYFDNEDELVNYIKQKYPVN